MTNNTFATFKLRLLSACVDGSTTFLVHMLLWFYIANQPTLPAAVSATFLYLILVVCNPVIAYNNILLTYYFNGSLGKLLTGLRIYSEDNHSLSFKRVFFRQTAGYSFSAAVFGLGFLAIINDPEKKAWHDKAVGSKVVVNRQQWVVGLIALLLSLTAGLYLLSQSYTKVQTGPIKAEIINTLQELNKSQQSSSTPVSTKSALPIKGGTPTILPDEPLRY